MTRPGPAVVTAADELGGRIDASPDHTRAGVRRRLLTLLAALDYAPPNPSSSAALVDAVDHALRQPDPNRIWLALAVLRAELPDCATTLRTLRAARLDGPLAALDAAFLSTALGSPQAQSWVEVEVATDKTLIDLHHTSMTTFATGIQRVAREVARRWQRDHAPLFVGWDISRPALRRLSEPEIATGLVGQGSDHEAAPLVNGPRVLVPWRCTYVLPELRADLPLVAALHGLLRFSGNRSGVIGFDCVAVTTGETVMDGMSTGFARMLSALSSADRIAAISEASATEFAGWRAMLAGAGRTGPAIEAIRLPTEKAPVSDSALGAARNRFVFAAMPMVLVVGSHEPRKNHLPILHAAELSWRAGLRFSLLFIGGNAWNSDAFTARVRQLEEINRPIQVLSAVRDDELWAAYQLASFTVFPSFNEGFGLPVAESLASGTPVITSDFGSMREIAQDGGGALLVDPRDDGQLTAALQRLLRDDALLAELTRQARGRTERTWDAYAEQVWSYLVEGLTA